MDKCLGIGRLAAKQFEQGGIDPSNFRHTKDFIKGPGAYITAGLICLAAIGTAIIYGLDFLVGKRGHRVNNNRQHAIRQRY